MTSLGGLKKKQPRFGDTSFTVDNLMMNVSVYS